LIKFYIYINIANISRIIFTGGLTDACVSSTVRQAWDRGYLCTVAEDACIASNKDDHDAEIKILLYLL